MKIASARSLSSDRSAGFARCLALLALGLFACSAPPVGRPVDFKPGTHAHVMLKGVAGKAGAFMGGGITPNLKYYGGKVIPNVVVHQVLYGAGTYLPQVQLGGGLPNMATFYSGITNSAHLDWLSEYNTDISPSSGTGAGTGQAIGRGTLGVGMVITPAPARNATSLTDADIQAELNAQISEGNLVTPDDNALYMVHLPKGKSVSMGGKISCINTFTNNIPDGFCGYHGTFTRSGQNVYYGVFPDMSAGSGCDVGCGPGSLFQNQTSVASHELVEAITDPEIGIAPPLAAPLAWYDSATGNGEIGDICNQQQGTVVGGDLRTYTVQKEWSNVAGACIILNSTPLDDFFISAAPVGAFPGGAFLAPSGTTALTVTTSLVSGASQSISLAVLGLPAGVTGVFNPTSITSGQKSTLTLTSSSAALVANHPFTIRGAGPSATRKAFPVLSISNIAISATPDLNVEATSAAGATSSYPTPVATLGGASIPVVCTPASGALFPFGSTPVSCTASDGNGSTRSVMWNVNVRDTTPPLLNLPSSLPVEATSSAGAFATFAPIANDAVDGPLPITCAPPSGTAMPLGNTTVQCSSSDSHGNSATGSFSVVVRDTTAPSLTCPANVTVIETDASGATATFSFATAADAVSSPVLEYSKPSGAVFPPGVNAVAVTATDQAGNVGTCTFNVTVGSDATPLRSGGCSASGTGSSVSALCVALGLLVTQARRRRKAFARIGSVNR